MRFAVLVVSGLTLVNVSRAEEKAEKAAAKKPLGTWVRESGDTKLVFDIKADTLTIKLTTPGGNLTAEAAYGITRDGTVFAILTSTESSGIEAKPEKGDLFSFAYSANKSELTISNLKGTRVNEDAQKLIEGVYTPEKKKK